MDLSVNGGHHLLHHHRNGFFSSSSSSSSSSDGLDRPVDDVGNSESVKLFSVSSDSAAGWSPPPSLTSSGHYIEHPVSRFDTLAGVAIRYGVEVADIKRLNGLVTDIQMYAHKTIQIPRPGRHPPSACLPNCSNGLRGNGELTPPPHAHGDLLESFQPLKLKPSQRKVSTAMNSLQGYYGLKPDNQTRSYGGCEMAVFSKGGCQHLEDGSSGLPLSLHRKSHSVANRHYNDNGESFDHSNEGLDTDSDRWSEKLIRRRQKSEMDFGSATPELLLKEDSSSVAGGFSASAGKNLALRSKASRASLANDAEVGPTSSAGVESVTSESLAAVRKSSSTSSLQEQESSSNSLLSIWNLKPDLQALSTAAIARPIFDGLPKRISKICTSDQPRTSYVSSQFVIDRAIYQGGRRHINGNRCSEMNSSGKSTTYSVLSPSPSPPSPTVSNRSKLRPACPNFSSCFSPYNPKYKEAFLGRSPTIDGRNIRSTGQTTMIR